MRTALVVFAAVLGALTAITFAFDGEAGPVDVVLNALAAGAAAVTVHYGRTEPGGPLRREGLAAGAVAVAVIVAIVLLRLS